MTSELFCAHLGSKITQIEPNKTELSQGTVTGLKEIDMGRKSGWFVIILMIINVDILNDIVVKVGYSFCSC